MVTPIDVDRDVAEVLARVKPQVASTRCTGALARTASSRYPQAASPTRIPACSPRRWRSERPRQGRHARRRHSGRARRDLQPFEVAKRHVLPPPYVVKPVNEGSSVGVIIVKEERRIRRRS